MTFILTGWAINVYCNLIPRIATIDFVLPLWFGKLTTNGVWGSPRAEATWRNVGGGFSDLSARLDNHSLSLNLFPHHLLGIILILRQLMKTRKISLVIFSLLMALMPIMAACTSDAQKYAAQGDQYYQQGKYDDAVTAYSQAIEMEPTNAEFYYGRGNVYLKKGLYQSAALDFDKAIQLDPDMALAYNGRGVAYGGQMQYDKAIVDFNKAIELDPDLAVAYDNRGLMYRDKYEYETSIIDFTRAIELDPNLAKAYFNRGLAYGRIGQTDKARADLEKCIELSTDPVLTKAAKDLEERL